MNTQNIQISTQFYNVVAKIDQLLRLYVMVKKSDSSKRAMVQKKVNQLLNSIKNEQIYYQIQHIITKTIKSSLQEVKIGSKAKIASISSIKSSPQYISAEKTSQQFVQLSMNKNVVSSQQVSKSNTFGSINSSSSLPTNKSAQNMQVVSQEFEMSSIEKSQQSSKYQDTLELLKNQFRQKQGNAHNMLAINQDIFYHLKDNDESNVLLFGINQPEMKNLSKKLYMCTLMKFSSNQVLSHNVSGQSRFIRQYKMFESNLRAPLGVIITGKSFQSITIEHLKFLLQLNCVSYIIIVMQSFKQRNGSLYQFSIKTMSSINDLNKIQYAEKLNQLKQQYGSKGVLLSNIQIVKQKLVITKTLVRSIANSVESVRNAIQIQTKSQCIKEEPNRFSYKLPTKYVLGAKSQYQILFLQNQILLYKMNFDRNNFQNFSKQVQKAHDRGKFLLATSFVKEAQQITKQFMRIILQCKTRDPFFFVNFSGINVKKVFIFTIKDGLTLDDIDNGSPIRLKELQKSNWFSNLIVIVDKKNTKQYQSETKIDAHDITPKKK